MAELLKNEALALEMAVPSNTDSTSSMNPAQEGQSPSLREEPKKNRKLPIPTTTPEGPSVLRGKIILNPGISPINYYASLFHTVTTFFNLTVTTTLQPLILLDTAHYNVNKKEIGSILAELILLQTLTKILFTPCFGYLIDNVGRKPMILLAASLCLLGYILVPFQTSVFPGYAFSKLLVANGGNILALIPLNADYIHDKSKGKATGITQAITSGGSFLGSVFVTAMISMKIDLARVHVIIGIIIMTSASIYSMGIKGGRYFLVREGRGETDFAPIKRKEDGFVLKIRKAMHALSKNGWLMITLVISTLARADYYLVTIIFALYIKSYDTTTEETKQSNHLVSMYQDLFFALGFIGNLVYGYILDKVSPMRLVFPALFLGIFGYVLVLFADSKYSIFIPILVVTAGIGMPALFNTANYLGIRNYPRDLRGVLSSLLNVFGVVGYLFLSTVGGYLFDHSGRSAPFMLFAIMLVVSTLAIVYIYKWMKYVEEMRRRRREEREGQQEGQAQEASAQEVSAQEAAA